MKVSRQSELIWEGFDLMQPHPYFMNIYDREEIFQEEVHILSLSVQTGLIQALHEKKKITCHEAVYYYLANFILFYLHWSR